MKGVRFLPLMALMSLPLAACSGDPYPDMHLKPTQEVSLGMSPSRTAYATLHGVQDAPATPMGLPIRLTP
jgi:hypothetical protein